MSQPPTNSALMYTCRSNAASKGSVLLLILHHLPENIVGTSVGTTSETSVLTLDQLKIGPYLNLILCSHFVEIACADVVRDAIRNIGHLRKGRPLAISLHALSESFVLENVDCLVWHIHYI